MSKIDVWIADFDKQYAECDKRVRERFKAGILRYLEPLPKVKKTKNQWPGLNKL